MAIRPEELEICLAVLQRIADDPAVMDHHERFKTLVAKIHKLGKKGQRKAAQAAKQQHDRQIMATTAIVQHQRGEPALHALPNGEQEGGRAVLQPINCYICKQPYTRLHPFYHLLCPSCAELNYQKRSQRADLRGRRALLTGGRIKIGYQTALRMLRDGAYVSVTTRFAQDAAVRFRAEPDFATWRERLRIYSLDLRDIPAVEAFTQHLLATEPALDIIINNAAQTVKRPLAFYQHLLEREQQPINALPADTQALLPRVQTAHTPLLDAHPAYRGQLANTQLYFPPDAFDGDGQQVDLRPSNSWLLKLDEVGTVEMLEVQLVNAVAPFILNSRLKPLLQRSPFARRFIVNVSAMEGQFSRENKTVFHPHTNMAKAALNMLTRTSAADYASSGIYMNSVDTGWITDENPHPKKTRVQEQHGFYTPLDIVDAMARIYDPIVQGLAEDAEPLYGHFLKDYAPYPW